MKYRRLGDSGIQLSAISLGSWLTYGTVVEAQRTKEIVAKAFELGVNFVDTANAYARGKAELQLGELLADYERSNYVLATKVFFPMGNGPNDKGLSRKHIFEQCHASLKRLQTDYIDLYQAHRYDEGSSVEEVVRAMDDLISQGKVLYWGFSEWPVQRIEEALQFCGDQYFKPKSSQPGYNLLRRGPEAEVFPVSAKAGIGQVVFSPLAEGVLTGKYKPNQSAPAESRAANERTNSFIKKFTDDAALLGRVQKLATIASELNCTISQLALAWILRRPEVTSVITGATRPTQLEENVKACDITLDAPTIQRIEDTLAP